MTSEDRLLLILRRLDEIERKLDHVLEELRTPTAIGCPPDERSCGIVIEGAYALCGDQLHVRDHEGRSWTVALKPGDNPEILARKLLREKFGKHHAFNQPIHYPPRSYSSR
jgi:hypothetical protein